MISTSRSIHAASRSPVSFVDDVLPEKAHLLADFRPVERGESGESVFAAPATFVTHDDLVRILHDYVPASQLVVLREGLARLAAKQSVDQSADVDEVRALRVGLARFEREVADLRARVGSLAKADDDMKWRAAVVAILQRFFKVEKVVVAHYPKDFDTPAGACICICGEPGDKSQGKMWFFVQRLVEGEHGGKGLPSCVPGARGGAWLVVDAGTLGSGLRAAMRATRKQFGDSRILLIIRNGDDDAIDCAHDITRSEGVNASPQRFLGRTTGSETITLGKKVSQEWVIHVRWIDPPPHEADNDVFDAASLYLLEVIA